MKSSKETRVYVYCDPRYLGNYKYQFKGGILKLEHKPFYIGCAGYSNHLRHLTGHGSSELVYQRIKKIREKKLDPVVKILKVYKDRKKARKLEEILIIAIGRQDLKTGPLLNRLDGYKKLSIKASKRRSKKSKRNWRNPEYRKNISEKAKKQWLSFEYRKKMSEINKKMWENLEYRKRMSIINSGEKNPMYGRTGKKNSMYGRTGELCPSSKLTEKEVLKIRKIYREEKIFQYNKIAQKFEVSRSCIYNVVNRHTWTHI